MSNRIICAAFPYLVVSGDDDDEGRTMRFSNSTEAIAWLHKRYGSGDDMGKRMGNKESNRRIGDAVENRTARETEAILSPSLMAAHSPQEVITAIFGKPSGNVVWQGAGTI